MPRQTPKRCAAAILEDALAIASEGYWVEDLDADYGQPSEEWVNEVSRHIDLISAPMIERLNRIRKGLGKFEIRPR